MLKLYKRGGAMVIYADVLIVVNLYINYFLIRAAAVFLRRGTAPPRCVLAAAVGAVGSLVILLPQLPFIVSALIKVLLGAVMVLAAFGRQKPFDMAVSMLCFLTVSFMFAGLMTALWNFFAPFGMYYRNGTAYFNIPIVWTALFTAASYGTVKLVRFIFDRRNTEPCSVVLSDKGASVELRGLPDSGNGLRDMFSGKPVIICSAEKIRKLLPENVRAYIDGESSEKIGSIRLAACSTVAAETLVPLFSVTGISINGKAADAVIGVSKTGFNGEFDCIFSPKLISL